MHGCAIFEEPGQAIGRAGQNEEGPAWPDGCRAVRILERQLDESAVRPVALQPLTLHVQLGTYHACASSSDKLTSSQGEVQPRRRQVRQLSHSVILWNGQAKTCNDDDDS